MAGLQPDDVVFKVEGRWVRSPEEFNRLLMADPIPDSLRLSLSRAGSRQDLMLPLAGWDRFVDRRDPLDPGGADPGVAGVGGVPVALQTGVAPAPGMTAGDWAASQMVSPGTMPMAGVAATPMVAPGPTAAAKPKRVKTEFEWMGFEMMPIGARQIQKQPALQNLRGGLVGEVSPASAAERAGIKANDVVVAINGQPVVDGTTLDQAIQMAGGRSWSLLEIDRAGTRMLVKLQ
ncbi:MAG: PDZ domain-containing protein [Magnetococcus sp. WYHC-3]